MRIGRKECFVRSFYKRLWLRLMEWPENRASVVRKRFVSFYIIMYRHGLVAETNESFLFKRMEDPCDGNAIGYNQKCNIAMREVDGR